MIIHIMDQGRALCGLEGPPYLWPEDHAWVGYGQHDEEQANCPGCVEAKKRYKIADEVQGIVDKHGFTFPAKE